MIIDSHVTLASDLVIPREFLLAQAANAHHRLAAHGADVSATAIADRLLAMHQDHDGDLLVAEMDAANVDYAFLVAADFSHVSTQALPPVQLAQLHQRITQRHPGRFGYFWGVDPRAGSGGPEAFEHGIHEYGAAGMKIYPLAGYSPSDRRLYPYYEVCAEYGLPVLTHTGPGWAPLDFTYGPPLLVDDAARDFPSVDFILGHGGVTHVEEASYLCAHRPNVHLDISQFPSMLSAQGWATPLNLLFHSGINHKILFGTCWPSFRMSTSLAEVLKAFTTGEVFEGVKLADRRMIMSGNIRRLTGDSARTPTVGGQR
ncbi:amidohydrolase family protein [Micromonospora sp. NPDC005215]|uniref:amidohydrolase family protein n=1 Tax=Micromonospora sp. NPDC005215 TaxID=3157024 RepID=UPI0033BCF603